jgi:hypothetical protein
MRVASVSRSIVLGGWLLALWWLGTGEPAVIVLTASLLAVWAASLARDVHRESGRRLGS